ncbi:MAG: homogentisate 1,2-dioxygenase [Actinomycetota bacterium]|nr:homogentisate 1,2-dioxygenase [Actinomycetota bacterium]
MPYYRKVGEIPRKRHQQFPQTGGGLYAEELMGSDGFSSESALLYHRHAPTALVKVEGVPDPPGRKRLQGNEPLLPRHLRTHDIEPAGDLVTGRHLLLGNDDVRISYAAASEPSELHRNAFGDECVFVEEGSARFESVFGVIDAVAGDYVVVPKATTYRWVPAAGSTVRTLVIEAAGHLQPPGRYFSPRGQLLEHAPFSERDLRGPEHPFLCEGEEVAVTVSHRGGTTRYTYAHHPFDVVGWDGCWYPYALSIHDFEPIVKRFHAPPPVHQTFEGPGFVVCSFCPRPFDFDPSAVAVSYNHANTDADEVLFYVGGDFMSRKGSGIGLGSISLHPAGFVHGPQPGSVEASLGQPATDEWAVMVDTFRPLELGTEAIAIEDTGYAWSWTRDHA